MPTVKQLQAELKRRGLQPTGKKAELEARLAEAEGTARPSITRGWSSVVEHALSGDVPAREDGLSVQERGKKAQTDATYNAAITDVTSAGDDAPSAVGQLWNLPGQVWKRRVARAVRLLVLALSVYQLAVCSTALVDGSRHPMLGGAEGVPALPALTIAVLALSRSSVLHAALPAVDGAWPRKFRQKQLDLALAAGVLLLLLPTAPLSVSSPVSVALLIMVRASVLVRCADCIAGACVTAAVPALGVYVFWCALKGWRLDDGVLRINRLQHGGMTWRESVSAAADDIARCKQEADNAPTLRTCTETAIEPLGRTHHDVVANTESLLCWGMFLSFICHCVVVEVARRIDHWHVRQDAAVHWAELRQSHYRDTIKAAFQSIDQDNDKTISREELRTTFIQIRNAKGADESLESIDLASESTSQSEMENIDTLISAVDTNCDGKIDYAEFEKMMHQKIEGWGEMLGLNADKHIEKAFLDCTVQSGGARQTNRRAISRVELQRAMAHVYSRQNKSDQEMFDATCAMIASVQCRQPSTPCAADGAAGRMSYKEFRRGFKGETDLHPAQKQMLVEWKLADRVRFLRSWSWQLPFGQVFWIPIPTLLPVLFGPAFFWIARLVATCRT